MRLQAGVRGAAAWGAWGCSLGCVGLQAGCVGLQPVVRGVSRLLMCDAMQAEAARFDSVTRRLARLQTSLQDSLSWLNWGQAACMRLGMVGGLLVACARTAEGRTTVGDFVMVQLYIVQLFAPLANLGGSYRMMMQAPWSVVVSSSK